MLDISVALEQGIHPGIILLLQEVWEIVRYKVAYVKEGVAVTWVLELGIDAVGVVLLPDFPERGHCLQLFFFCAAVKEYRNLVVSAEAVVYLGVAAGLRTCWQKR